LKPGDRIELTVGDAKPTAQKSVTANYPGLVSDVEVGNVMLVDNGVIRLRVLAKKKQRLECEALTPGKLASHRHINLPGVNVRLPALTAKDLDDIALGAELGLDFVALSFAHQRSDLEELRRELQKLKSTAAVVAKIETQAAVQNLDEIIAASDVVLIARGDLGIEMPMEELPTTQRKIVKHCIRAGKPVILATHLLESMVDNPIPTRAEVTDVANAVFEQSDALLLTGETSAGHYPVECVKVLERIACRIERSGGAGYASDAQLRDPRQKTVMSAVVLANSLPHSKLIVFTRHGTMARYVANLRPHSPIFAFTPSEHVCRQLTVCWGTQPILMHFKDDPNRTIRAAEKILAQGRMTKPGDNLVVLTDVHSRGEMFDSVQVRQARETFGDEEVDERPLGESMMD
jgi:pyruvate kinase